jgi:hypothetical protein
MGTVAGENAGELDGDHVQGFPLYRAEATSAAPVNTA